MKERFVTIKLFLLLVAAPLAIWFGALSGTVENYVGYHRLGKELAVVSAKGEGSTTFSGFSELDLVSDGSVIAGIEKSFAGAGVHVSSYVPGVGKDEAGLSLRGAEIELKGDYKSLLKVLHSLESDGRYAVSGIMFERKDVRERSVTLKLTICQLLKNE